MQATALVAKPAEFRLLDCKLAGRPETLKYMPLPCVGSAGGAVRDTAWVDWAGNPSVVTETLTGTPANKVTRFGLLILGASSTYKVRFCCVAPVVAVSVSSTVY
jgi:hypothetical protein